MEQRHKILVEGLGSLNSSLGVAIAGCSVTKEDLRKVKESYEKKENELTILEDKYKMKEYETVSLTSTVELLNKKLKYGDSKLENVSRTNVEYDRKMEDIINKVKVLKLKLANSDVKISDLSKEKHRVQKKVIYFSGQLMESKQLQTEYREKDIVIIENELQELTAKTESLNRENGELEKLVTLLQDDEVVTFQDGKYCDDVREVVMKLLSLNVDVNKVDDVIKVVLRKLAKKEVTSLPSTGTKCRLMQEALRVAQLQVAEAMTEDEHLLGNCLHGNGTSKYSRHYQNFQVTTSSGRTLSFGLTEIAGGDATSILQTFTNTIDDMCDILGDKEKNEHFAKLFVQLNLQCLTKVLLIHYLIHSLSV